VLELRPHGSGNGQRRDVLSKGVAIAPFVFLLEMINMTEIEFIENVERGVQDDPKNSGAVGYA
jgi:hypothetical protein